MMPKINNAWKAMHFIGYAYIITIVITIIIIITVIIIMCNMEHSNLHKHFCLF